MTLEVGWVGETTHIVTPEDTAEVYGSGLLPVLSTPCLVAWMENTAQQGVAPYLEPGDTTVGARIAVDHLAATPVGMAVRVRAELVAISRRRLYFQVEAWDAVDRIGAGEHVRVIIDPARFMQRVTTKQSA